MRLWDVLCRGGNPRVTHDKILSSYVEPKNKGKKIQIIPQYTAKQVDSTSNLSICEENWVKLPVFYISQNCTDSFIIFAHKLSVSYFTERNVMMMYWNFQLDLLSYVSLSSSLPPSVSVSVPLSDHVSSFSLGSSSLTFSSSLSHSFFFLNPV